MHAVPMIGGAHYPTLEWVRFAGAGGFLSHRRPADRGGATRPLDRGSLRRPAVPSCHCRALRTGNLSRGDRPRAGQARRFRHAPAWLWRRGDEQRDVWTRLPGTRAWRQWAAQLRVGAGLALHVPDPSLWIRGAEAALAAEDGSRRG